MRTKILVTGLIFTGLLLVGWYCVAVRRSSDRHREWSQLHILGNALSHYTEHNGRFPDSWEDMEREGIVEKIPGDEGAIRIKGRKGEYSEIVLPDVERYRFAFGKDISRLQITGKLVTDENGERVLLIQPTEKSRLPMREFESVTLEILWAMQAARQ